MTYKIPDQFKLFERDNYGFSVSNPYCDGPITGVVAYTSAYPIGLHRDVRQAVDIPFFIGSGYNRMLFAKTYSEFQRTNIVFKNPVNQPYKASYLNFKWIGSPYYTQCISEYERYNSTVLYDPIELYKFNSNNSFILAAMEQAPLSPSTYGVLQPSPTLTGLPGEKGYAKLGCSTHNQTYFDSTLPTPIAVPLDNKWQSYFPFSKEYLQGGLKTNLVIVENQTIPRNMVPWMQIGTDTFSSKRDELVAVTPTQTTIPIGLLEFVVSNPLGSSELNPPAYFTSLDVTGMPADPSSPYSEFWGKGLNTNEYPNSSIGPFTSVQGTKPFSFDLLMKFYYGIGEGFDQAHYWSLPVPIQPVSGNRVNHTSNFLPNHYYFSDVMIRGTRYGVKNMFPENTKVVYNRDHYGHLRDLLEQRQFTKFYDLRGTLNNGGILGYPITTVSAITVRLSGTLSGTLEYPNNPYWYEARSLTPFIEF